MNKIDSLRERIDRIDDQLLKLINRRANLAVQIGKEKGRLGNSSHFHVPHRERDILERLSSQNIGPFSDPSVEAVFREVFSATLALEKPLNISYLGPQTTFTHQAAIRQFGKGAAYLAQPAIDAVFKEVEQDRAHYGVIPIENSIEGVVNLTLDCFVNSTLLICDELRLVISLYLISKNKDQKKIRTLYSHPQPLAQSRNWLNQNLPGVEHVETSSTAQAAMMALKNPNSAAVAGKLAAEHYQLRVLAEKIEDQPKNFTRFLVITKTPAKKAKLNKTSIMFSIKDEAGALLKNLQLFAKNKINLSKIQSRPLPNRPWEYLFFLDFECHARDKTVARVIDTIRRRSLFLKVLGSYPRKIGANETPV